jgi:iron complex outermembrane receptor protein
MVHWSLSANVNATSLLRVANGTDGLPVTNAQQDAWLTSVTPRYKIIAGGKWFVSKWGIAIHENVFGSASDEVTIYAGPNTFSTTVFDRFDERAKATTDVSVDYSVVDRLVLMLGANNVFNAYPDRLAAQDQYLGWQYDGWVSQTGINGGFYYASLKYSF